MTNFNDIINSDENVNNSNNSIKAIQNEYLKDILSNTVIENNQNSFKLISSTGYQLEIPNTIYYISKIIKTYYDNRTGYIFENLSQLKKYGHIYFKNTELQNINFRKLGEKDILLGEDNKEYTKSFKNHTKVKIIYDNTKFSFKNFELNKTILFLPDNINFGSYEKDEVYLKYTFDFLLGINFDIYDKFTEYDKNKNCIFHEDELYCFYNIINWIEAEKGIDIAKKLFDIKSKKISFNIVKTLIGLDIFSNDYLFCNKIDNYLCENINTFNCLTYFEFAHKYNLLKTKQKSSTYYLKHPEQSIKCYHYNKNTLNKNFENIQIIENGDENLVFILDGNEISLDLDSISNDVYKDTINIILNIQNYINVIKNKKIDHINNIYNTQKKNNYTIGYYFLSIHVKDIISNIDDLKCYLY